MYEVLLTRARGSGQEAGSWKAVIREHDETQELNGCLEGKSQHQVAIIAACRCFEAIPEDSCVAFYTTNQVLVRTMEGDYDRHENKDLWAQLDQVIGGRHVRWEYRCREALEARLVRPRSIADAEDTTRAQLGGAYEFLPGHDRFYAVSSYCLLEECPPLPEYSAVVMPMAKAYEGYLKELCVEVGLATAEELENPSFSLGSVFDQNRAQTKEFRSRAKRQRGLLDTLKGDLTFSRHFLMHSDPGTASRVESVEEARKHIGRLSQNMKNTHAALVRRT